MISMLRNTGLFMNMCTNSYFLLITCSWRSDH